MLCLTDNYSHFKPEMFFVRFLRPALSYNPALVQSKFYLKKYDWHDFDIPDKLIQLTFKSYLSGEIVTFNFCKEDFKLQVNNIDDLLQYKIKGLIESINLESDTPTMRYFYKYLDVQSFAHIITDELEISSIADLKKTLKGPKGDINDIAYRFEYKNTKTYQICCNILSPYNKGCYLIIGDDAYNMIPITTQRLAELLSISHKKSYLNNVIL